MGGLLDFLNPSGGLGAQGGLTGRIQQFNAQNPGALVALGAGIMNRNPAAGFAAAAPMAAEGQVRNQTAEYLMRKGLAQNPAEAMALAANPVLLAQALKKANGGDVNFGVEPKLFTDPTTGKLVYGTFGNDGSFKKIDTGGLTPEKNTYKDLGTAWGVLDAGGNLVSTVPKDNEGAAFDKHRGGAIGDVAGEAATILPQARSMAQTIATQIQDLKSDPDLPVVLGKAAQYTPNWTARSNRVQSKIDQLKGGAFLNARVFLKGQGPITDYESARAEAAYARMEQAQSVGDFNQALDEFNSMVQQGVKKYETQARMKNTDDPTAATISPPGDYKSKYGLD